MEQSKEEKKKITTPKTIKIRKVKTNQKQEVAKEKTVAEVEALEDSLQEQNIQESASAIEEVADVLEENLPEETLDINSYAWEYQIKEKKGKFYGFLFGISALLIFISFQLNNWFISLFVVLGFVLMIQRNTQVKEFGIDETGVYIQGNLIAWEEIKSFNVEAMSEDGLVIFSTKNFPFIKIYLPFPQEQHKEILFLLEKYSVYKDVSEGFVDKIIKKIVF
jgi:tetrahydromethanopterin S-methyltransferase subunit B